LLTAGVLVTACSTPADPPVDLPSTLTVLVQEDHAFYFQNETKHWVGFSHELIERMEHELGVAVEVRSFATYDAMFQAFAAGVGDVMCPALAIGRAAPEPAILTVLEREQLPTIRVKVSDDEDVVWVLRRNRGGIAGRMNAWLHTTHSQLFVANLYEKYFAHLGLFNKFDLVMLKVRYRRDLPLYRHLFDEAGRRHGIDPLFLAAMSYQESQWNPQAQSRTGVRGLMMLTQDTADAIGVTDRLDPRQSVFGGTKYLTQLRTQIDDEVRRPDNDYYALAAYNIGLGHVEDAQEIARRHGQDDRLWSNLRDTLPLLSDPAYYTTLKYGKARGQEPVRYVDSIRNYYALLSALERPIKRPAGAP
jgi:membrane-bound lytic murein transglycosylase MltF